MRDDELKMSEALSTSRDTPRRGYRIAEAAMYMGVSSWFVEQKIRSGELPALRLCRHYTVLRKDMDDFLDAKVLARAVTAVEACSVVSAPTTK
jgi:excisionase family DNA binding protein